MNTTWTFTNITSLADHLDNKAAEHRASAARYSTKSIKHVSFIAKAAENESLAYLLRHTSFKESAPVA